MFNTEKVHDRSVAKVPLFEEHAWEEGLVQLLPTSPMNISNPILGTPRTTVQVVHCTMP